MSARHGPRVSQEVAPSARSCAWLLAAVLMVLEPAQCAVRDSKGSYQLPMGPPSALSQPQQRQTQPQQQPQPLPYPFNLPTAPARPPRPPSFKQIPTHKPAQSLGFASLTNPGPPGSSASMAVDYPAPAEPAVLQLRREQQQDSKQEQIRQRFSRTFLAPYLKGGPRDTTADVWTSQVEASRAAQKQVMAERQQAAVHQLYQHEYPNLPLDSAGKPMQFRETKPAPSNVQQMDANANYAQPDRTIPPAMGQGSRVSNPFVDKQAETPKYLGPSYVNRPWDVFLIPEMTDRFYVEFLWNKKMLGRWYYDYDKRETKVEYIVDPGPHPGQLGNRAHLKGFFMSYDFLDPFMLKYDYGSGAGESCYRLSLPTQFARMFSPRTWRRINVENIQQEEADFTETHRTSTEVYMRGNWNNTKISYAAYTNGTLRRVSIGRNTWEFQNFVDLSELDNYAARNNEYLQHNQKPELACSFDGPLVEDERVLIQKWIPFPLTKPYQAKRDTNYDQAMVKRLSGQSGG